MFRTAARIVIAVWLIATGRAALAENRVALVIGNSNYTLAPLDNPKNDADDVAAALQRLQFDVTELKDLTVSDFDKAIDAFEAKAKSADVAFFFFSGHGVQIDKRGYLAPVDIKAESESSALRELEAIQEVVARIENTAKVSIIVFDACRDSPLQERLRRIAVDKNRALVPPKGLPPVSVVGSNTLIVYATVPGETSSDGAGRNSPFTASLLKNIETPGLEIELLFKRVTADVLNATHGKQQPERLSRLQNELVLRPANAETKPQAPDELARLREQMARLEETLKAREYKPGIVEQQTKQRTVAAAQKKPVVSGDACDGLLVSVAQSSARPCIKPGSGESFKDCPQCPELVIVPSGSFTMGSPGSEPERADSEAPQHKVTIAKPFAAGRFAVTFAEWDACLAAGGCGGYKPEDQGWGRADRPVINVSWDDAKAYVSWLSKKTGQSYRLLSEAEREYATRAGTTAPFWWGASVTPDKANYNGTYVYSGGGKKGEYREKTVPVKSFESNAWGLHQVHGNVREWVEDCWHDSYTGAPADGSAWTNESCGGRVLRGGSWRSHPQFLRSAYRSSMTSDSRSNVAGCRVARTLE